MEHPKAPQRFSIGALSRASGVPIDTLRTWERRYGFPKPERTDTGHRRYAAGTLERLQLVRKALQLGHRAATVLGADTPALRELVDRSTTHDPDHDAESERVVDAWLALVHRFDGRGFERELGTALAELGVPKFLGQRAGPFIHKLGESWADGRLGVRHEHFASERLGEFFLRQWRPLSDASGGPAVVCATPSGERHALGLQMAAFTLALNNLRVVYLGADLPAAEIAQTARQHLGRAVVLSAARGAAVDRLAAECLELRTALGPELPIVVGGAGFGEALPGLTHLDGLPALDRWARAFSESSRPFPPRIG